MNTIHYRGNDGNPQQVTLQEDETVLNALLRCGIDVPFGCRTGVCQSCIMQAENSTTVKTAQKGLREVQKQQGYFLSCCCQPTEPVVVSLSNEYRKETTVVLEKSMLTPNTVRVRVKKTICYRSGQYMTLWKDENTARTYSIASHPTHDDFIEFHIRVYDDGIFSPWAANELAVGDELKIQGPMGECFYTNKDKLQTLFLSGLGTGLAPLYGIARDALLSGHSGKILLLLGARHEQSLYYQSELATLSTQFSNFEVRYSVQEIKPELQATHSRESDIYATAKMLVPDFTGTKVFLCGGDNFVRKMKKQCFLSGANMGDIHSDTFLSFPK